LLKRKVKRGENKEPELVNPRKEWSSTGGLLKGSHSGETKKPDLSRPGEARKFRTSTKTESKVGSGHTGGLL